MERKTFLKLEFSGKLIDINLPSILRKSLDYIPQTLQYKSPPTILFTRTKKIGSQIFNYKHTIDNVVTNE